MAHLCVLLLWLHCCMFTLECMSAQWALFTPVPCHNLCASAWFILKDLLKLFIFLQRCYAHSHRYLISAGMLTASDAPLTVRT